MCHKKPVVKKMWECNANERERGGRADRQEEVKKMQEVANSTRHTLASFLREELQGATPLRTSNLVLFSWCFESFRGFSRASGHFDFHVNALRASTSSCVVSMKNRRRVYRRSHIHSILHCRRSYLRLTHCYHVYR